VFTQFSPKAAAIVWLLDNATRVARPIHMRMNQDMINT
jgi:hypothetical protein